MSVTPPLSSCATDATHEDETSDQSRFSRMSRESRANCLLAVRWARVYPRSDSQFDSRNPLHIRAQIAQPWGD